MCMLRLLKFQFLAIYRPPDHNVELMNQLCSYIDNCCCDNKTLLIVGDLNCSKIDWVNHTVKGDGSQNLFFNTVSGLGFSQFVDKPTRGDNILDIVLCNDPLFISNVFVNEPFSNSDHACITFIVNLLISDSNSNDIDCIEKDGGTIHDSSENCSNCCNSDMQHVSIMPYDWCKADWVSLNTVIASFDWSELFCDGKTSDDLISSFYSILEQAIEAFVPLKPKMVKSSNKKKKHYPKHIRKKFALKARLWRKYRLRKTFESKIRYRKVAESCASLLHMYEVPLK